ncbi:uncharacterized protein [Notamacropus eugenii]|uniref:uncharacterized protein isoform X1 n=1 Tax=Notamacropus eugenii TaxID=9315 RepID=UPI003B66CA78
MSTCSQLSKKKANETVKKSVRFMEPEVIREKHQMTFEAEEKKKEKVRVQKKPTAGEVKGTSSAAAGPIGSNITSSVHIGSSIQMASPAQSSPSGQMASSVRTGTIGQVDSHGHPRIHVLVGSRLVTTPRGLVHYRSQTSLHNPIHLHGQTGPQEEISTRGCSFTGSRIYPRGPPGSHQQAKLHGQGGPYSQGGSQGQAGPSDQASPHDQAGPYDQTDSYSAQPPAKRPRGKKGMKKDEERGRMNLNEDDLCDCLERACLGCFYLCPQCQSTKCGPTCRSNQNWIYKANTNEGGEVVSTFPFSHAKY